MPRAKVKPNRFERAVNECVWLAKYGDESYEVVHRDLVIKLLRKEHEWVRRAVEQCAVTRFGAYGNMYYAIDREQLLAKLAQRRK